MVRGHQRLQAGQVGHQFGEAGQAGFAFLLHIAESFDRVGQIADQAAPDMAGHGALHDQQEILPSIPRTSAAWR